MRRAFTLIDTLVVVAIMGVLLAFGLPRMRGAVERWSVRSAVTEIKAVFATARQLAIMQARYSTVRVDSAERAILILRGPDTLQIRRLGAQYGVSVRSNRDTMVYSPIGLGYGAANQSIVVTRGAAVDTVVLSRLGRVR